MGLAHNGPPQLPTRVLPKSGGYAIPLPILRDILDHTQRLVYCSAQVAAFGASPDFSNMTQLDRAVHKSATLLVSPFSAGSFVIPAELSEEPADLSSEVPGGANRKFYPAKIVTTFHDLMTSFGRDGATGPEVAPIGFIQTLEELGKVMTRAAAQIEYTPDDGQHERDLPPILVDQPLIARAVAAHKRRLDQKREGYATVVGRLVELNILLNSFKVSVTMNNKTRTIGGSYAAPLTEPLIRRLGRVIQVSGPAESVSGRGVTKITATEYLDVDEIEASPIPAGTAPNLFG